MSPKVSLNTTLLDLDRALDSALDLYAAVRDFCRWTYEGIHENALHPAQARRVVSLCFLASVASFEQFLEHSFVRYLAGATTKFAGAPSLRFGPAKSLRDAYAVISGKPKFDPERQHLNWSVDEALARAEIFFGKSNPYSACLSPSKRALEDASIIRNRVAHTSAKSRASFLEVARRLRKKKLHQGYSVGDLLLEPVYPDSFTPLEPGDLFTAYIELFREIAVELAS